jgi:hypothetical protein
MGEQGLHEISKVRLRIPACAYEIKRFVSSLLSNSTEAKHDRFPSMHANVVDFDDHAPSGFALGHGNIAHDDARPSRYPAHGVQRSRFATFGDASAVKDQ